jgi:hypothetical protein
MNEKEKKHEELPVANVIEDGILNAEETKKIIEINKKNKQKEWDDYYNKFMNDLFDLIDKKFTYTHNEYLKNATDDSDRWAIDIKYKNVDENKRIDLSDGYPETNKRIRKYIEDKIKKYNTENVIYFITYYKVSENWIEIKIKIKESKESKKDVNNSSCCSIV